MNDTVLSPARHLPPRIYRFLPLPSFPAKSPKPAVLYILRMSMDAENIQRDIIRFFWSPKNRYWKRKAREIIKLVQAFSSTSFGKALGDQGELLADSAFFNAGFALRAKTAREWS